jgi:hypothetical protein
LSNGVSVHKGNYKKREDIGSLNNSEIAIQAKKTENSKVFIKTISNKPIFVSNLNSNRAYSKKISFEKEINKKLVVSKLNSIANYFEPGEKCDEIIFKNGEELRVKLLEINEKKIVYKKCDNLTGPSYTKSKKNIFMVLYSDGSKDIFVTDDKSESKKTNKDETDIPLIYGGMGLFFSTLVPLPFLGLILGCIGMFKYKKNPEKSTTMAKLLSIVSIIIGSLISLYVVALLIYGF